MGADSADDTSRLYKRVGAAIAAARGRRGLSQGQLASAVGSKQTNISDYERGITPVPLHTLVAIVEALGDPPGRFYDEAGLVPLSSDPIDGIRADGSISDDRRELIIEIYETGRARAAQQD